jgi:HK97 family phage prohead protease
MKILRVKRAAKFVEPSKADLADAFRDSPFDFKCTPIFKVDRDTGKPTNAIDDYYDVIIEGYASVFGSPERRDSHGDYILPGSYDRTIADFSCLPAMLVDHNESKGEVGTWLKWAVTPIGLVVRGKISNAWRLRELRVALVERRIKGLSVGGGLFFYTMDGHGVRDASVGEISLTKKPADSRALILNCSTP